MDWKSFIFGVLTMSIILLALASFGLAHVGKFNSVSGGAVFSSASSAEIPEKCQVPAGQDLASWKEHLGHHAETKECLQYFN